LLAEARQKLVDPDRSGGRTALRVIERMADVEEHP
jgi:hypothetical protein